jgi:hypothetical protein
MTTSIKSSLSFLSRPYDGIEIFASALDSTILKLESDEVHTPGLIELPTSQFPISKGQIEIYFTSELIKNLREKNIDPKTVEIVCFIQGNVIAESQMIFREKIAKSKSPIVIDLQGDPLILQSPNGFNVRVSLILTKDGSWNKVQSIEAGVWLANIVFRLSPHSTYSLFSAAPLDDQLRSSFGLPKGCLTYIHIQDDFLLADSLEDQVDIYIDVSVLRLLQESKDSAVASTVQLDLATSLFIALICKTATQLGEDSIAEFEELQLQKLPVRKVIQHISNSSKFSEDELLKFALHDPGRLRAAIEAHLRSMTYISAALREVS